MEVGGIGDRHRSRGSWKEGKSKGGGRGKGLSSVFWSDILMC